jgi:hypothetical protein
MAENAKISGVAGSCIDLDAADVEQVTAFLAAATRAFALKDVGLLETLSHPGGDPQGRRNSREFDQSLMVGGDTIQRWAARPYMEPKWRIMREFQHHPPPTIWVDVTLNDGKRDYPYCFALAPGEGGKLLSCYYIDRVRRRKPKPK